VTMVTALTSGADYRWISADVLAIAPNPVRRLAVVDLLTRNWWLFGLRGLAALAFGLLTLFNPTITLAVLVLLFGGYALVYGAFTAFAAVANRRGEPYWGALLLAGLLSVIVGILTFMMPGVTAVVLLYFIAAWAMVIGALEIVAAVRLRKVITGEWLMILGGALSVGFGLALVLYPAAGALAVTLWIGVYATVLGLMMLVLAFRLRGWRRWGSAGMASR
jgi:uncharacterized membrane protein HdeD (DUF308 family)